MATREQIKAIILYMKGLFPNYHPELEGEWNAIDALLDALGDISPEDLKIAVRAACNPGTGRQFAPSADEIRSALAGLHAQASGLKAAGEAWQEVMTYIVDNGCHNGTPEFSHPIIKKAVQAIGLEEIGMSEDVMVERAHFLKIYADLSQRALSDSAMLPQVSAYIESQKQIEGGIKSLAENLSFKKLEAK